jgi:hypothetical protein
MTLAFIAFGVSFAGMTVAFIIAVQHRNYWRSHRRQRGLVDNATALTEPVPAVCIGGLGAYHARWHFHPLSSRCEWLLNDALVVSRTRRRNNR